MKHINWIFAAGILLVAISLFFSATGLVHLFAGAGAAIVMMAIAFELAKVTGTVWLIRNWKLRALPVALSLAIALLVGVSSLGIYGYLGRAYNVGRREVVESGSAVQVLTADVERLQEEKDRLNGQIETIPAEQGTNRRLLTRTLQPQIERIEASIQAKRDSLAHFTRQSAVATNDIGELRYAADLLGVTQDDIAKYVITTLAILLDPLAVLLVLASGVKGAVKTQEEIETVPEAAPVRAGMSDPLRRVLQQVKDGAPVEAITNNRRRRGGVPAG